MYPASNSPGLLDASSNTPVIAIVLVIVAFLALVWYAASRLRTVSPEEALIVVGKGLGKGNSTSVGGSRSRIHFAGKVFVIPLLQTAFPLSLKQHQVEMLISGPDKKFINVTVKASLNFKFGNNPEDVSRAAERFLKHPDAKLEESLKNALEGSLRSIIGEMDVQSINSNRKEFHDNILASAKEELALQGIKIDVLNISDIKTPGTIDYLGERAKAETARAKADALIAESMTKQESEAARLAQEEETAKRQRDLDIKKAQFLAETKAADEKAAAAGERAKAEQAVEVAKLQRIALTEEALVAQERLDIDMHKPADAAAYVVRIEAQAEKDKAILEAQAEGETKTIAAAADAAAAEHRANAVRQQGEAEASVIEAKGAAEASAESARAEALSGYTKEAIAYSVSEKLPEIMAANAQAVASIDNYTVISTDGASDAVKQTTRMLTEGLAAVEGAVGMDLSGFLSGLVGGTVAAKTTVEPAMVEAAAPAAPVVDGYTQY